MRSERQQKAYADEMRRVTTKQKQRLIILMKEKEEISATLKTQITSLKSRLLTFEGFVTQFQESKTTISELRAKYQSWEIELQECAFFCVFAVVVVLLFYSGCG